MPISMAGTNREHDATAAQWQWQCGGGVSENTADGSEQWRGASGPAALRTSANARQCILPRNSATLVRPVPRRTGRRPCVRTRPVAALFPVPVASPVSTLKSSLFKYRSTAASSFMAATNEGRMDRVAGEEAAWERGEKGSECGR